MYYRTFGIEINPTSQLSIEDLYNGITPTQVGPLNKYKTVRVNTLPDSWRVNQDRFNAQINNFLTLNAQITIEYTEYNIPKHSGGYRTIAAPSVELKATLKELYSIITRNNAYAHDCAYAYVKNRTCYTALDKHRTTNNRWFYKFDLHNFFPTCTTELLTRVLPQVYPFCLLTADNLNGIIRFCTYHNALPQGSPMSPLLCNMILLPFDWAMYYSIRHFDGVYTRYADDILISLPKRKDVRFIENIIQGHLPEGLTLNREKSRCGSIAGHNFNLGLVLNKDRVITLGHEKKMKLKAKLNNFIFDFTNRRFWSIIDTQVLQGELNYFKNIEPEYATFVITRLQNKHHSPSISSMFADIIAGRV